MRTPRRGFLKTVALAGGAAAQTSNPAPQSATSTPPPKPKPQAQSAFEYPRTFTGRQLAMVAFPLGGVASGGLSLGGRGQLRDWEIFNRPNKGYAPDYAFPGIWVRSGGRKPVARVLEARILPPYEGADGLGSRNVPGLSRLQGAVFTGEYPLATVAFRDSRLPVTITLEAFTPFFPLDAEDSGLPVAVLRYRVRNPGKEKAEVSIAFALDNPVGSGDERENEYRKEADFAGLFMRNPGLAGTDPMFGSLALVVVGAGGKVTCLRGWPRAKWWAGPQFYWDDFSSDGELGPEVDARAKVGALCLRREIAPGAEAAYTFLLSWHFPNRTPQWCGWHAPKGHEQDIIGNHYTKRFADAWQAAQYAAANLPRLEAQTRRFAAAVHESTLPPAVKDAAMSNLSTLATPVCFRTADGEFHGFEGGNDKSGCCYGSCTHVWNYEAATQHLFPALARSLRQAAFGYSMDDQGAMHFREVLPAGLERSGFPAADGQMGQIIKAYLDWRLSGDTEWLRRIWPRVKRGLEFAWIPGGWDADRDGVLEGVQHNTYDVEFFGPNPMCGIYYLGALRAGEEMARALGDSQSAAEYRRLFNNGSQWIDANLFNGEYYIQQVRGYPLDQIAKVLVSKGGAEDTEHPDFQLGEGCLVDQLVGQYLAEVAGLGSLVDPEKVRKTLASIYKYNYKRVLFDHDCVQRTFALNDEAALVICDYGRTQRPKVPFSYYAEVMTGFEYSAAVLMLYAGMIREGLECIENIRRRYDGERRNPYDEAECGHHYARAMAAWSAVLALSGFRYHGFEKSVVVAPRIHPADFRSIWSTATAWGTFSHSLPEGKLRFTLAVAAGQLVCRSVELSRAAGAQSSARLGKIDLPHQARGRVIVFPRDVLLKEGDKLELTL
jgi:non-lysosomal glucosylceramidase